MLENNKTSLNGHFSWGQQEVGISYTDIEPQEIRGFSHLVMLDSRVFVVFGTNTAERASWLMAALNTACLARRRGRPSVYPVAFRARLSIRSFDGFFVSTVTSHIKSRSTPLSTCHQHSRQCKCCNLRTSNATLAAELNIENRGCPNCSLTVTPKLVMTSATRAHNAAHSEKIMSLDESNRRDRTERSKGLHAIPSQAHWQR